MTNAAPPLLERVADHLRRRLLATLVAEVGDAAEASPKIVRNVAGLQHVRLQVALEDFAASNGFLEFHDFDELLPDVLAVATVNVFIGEASAAPLLRPGSLDMRQRIEACISELALIGRDSWFEHAMFAVCVGTQRAAEQWSRELTQLVVAAALVNQHAVPYHRASRGRVARGRRSDTPTVTRDGTLSRRDGASVD